MAVHTETDTVIKRILPYLTRRGYDATQDIEFETATEHPDRYSKGYVDLLVKCGNAKPNFLIEAKRSSKSLTNKDAKQAIDYGRGNGVPFVIVTNGRQIQAFNTKTGAAIKWDGSLIEKIPSRKQLKSVMRAFKANPEAVDIPLGTESSLPFRPGLPLKQLNALFARCHNKVRKIEKNEEHAFDDFSKLLFLKLLEEKSDTSEFTLPYSYLFHELANKSESEADQVRDSVQTMINAIRSKTPYGEVLGDELHLKNAKTFRYIISELSSVSFYDSSLDSKGAAFEYFVRATLKGKKLGQYFTPRSVVQLMSVLIGKDKIYNSVATGTTIKVLDPACGTGGFLVFLMQAALQQADEALEAKKIMKSAHASITLRIMRETFFGADANYGVACAAKMNMIVAGDGHTNIRAEDSLSAKAEGWSTGNPDCDIVITKPPFGTSEADTLEKADWEQYPLRLSKGQQLFIQKMVCCVKPGGDICTVIDDGLLNTASSIPLREWLFQNVKVRAIVRLPEETFKPNKINVRASILVLEKLLEPDVDLENDYLVTFIDLQSLGYMGSGDPIRGFDLDKVFSELTSKALEQKSTVVRSGTAWRAFDVKFKDIKDDSSFRLDLKYWEPEVRKAMGALVSSGQPTIKTINTIKTRRGSSPKADDYVDEKDGYALVIKAGTNITKYGEVINVGDYIEKDVFDGMSAVHVIKGDILIASTGTGTLGKAGVYELDRPAIADGHVTIVRVDQSQVDPHYLADYLRVGAGAAQIERFYTGSTGLIELTPEDVDRILVDAHLNIKAQQQISCNLRKSERNYLDKLSEAETSLSEARKKFSEKPAQKD